MSRPIANQVIVRAWEIRPGWPDMAVFGVILGVAWWLTGVPPLLLAAGAATGITALTVLIAVKQLRGEAADPPEDGHVDL